MELLEVVDRFTNEPEGESAYFDKIQARVRPYLWRFLSDLVRSAEDREDVINETLAKIWSKRLELKFTHLGAWWTYVSTTARRVAYDRAHLPTTELVEEISAAGLAAIESVAWLATSRERMYAAADCLWLGDASADERSRPLKLLAAQLHFIDCLPAEEILTILPDGACTHKELLAWLRNPQLALHVAFHETYYSNDRLAGHLLRPLDPLSSVELEEVARAALARKPGAGFAPWDEFETKVLLLRFRNGLLTEKIAQMVPFEVEAVESVIQRIARMLPFRSIARLLSLSFSESGVTPAPLGELGLYKRLAFQYHAADELPHKQMLERMEPVAEAGSFHLTAGMISVWLANGRLFSQLTTFVSRKTACG